MTRDFLNEPVTSYRGFLIVHDGGATRPRITNAFSVHEKRSATGYKVAHTGPASDEPFATEAEAHASAVASAKAWIDENRPEST